MAGLSWVGWSSVFTPCLPSRGAPRPRPLGPQALREIHHPRPNAATEGVACLAALQWNRHLHR